VIRAARLLPFLALPWLGGCLSSNGGHALDEPAPVAPLPETIPAPEELVGVWESTQLSGGLDEVARAFVYAIREDGEYTAAVLVDAETGYEWLALAGGYDYADGVLDLGPGAPSFMVRKQGTLLLFRGDAGNLVLRPFLAEPESTPAGSPQSPAEDQES